MALTTRPGSPSKGTASVQYPLLPPPSRSTADQPEDNTSATDDKVLTLRSQITALQQVQVEQALKAQQTEASLNDIKMLLVQINEQDQSWGRS